MKTRKNIVRFDNWMAFDKVAAGNDGRSVPLDKSGTTN